jgi:site-specific DNA recombinase
LREKIGAIRSERDDIQRSLDNTQKQLDVGRSIFYTALKLLDRPAELYEQGNETVRSTLNKAIFVKFLIDGMKVVGHELQEPFDVLTAANERGESMVYLRQAGALPRSRRGTRGGGARSALPYVATCPTLMTEDGAPADLSLTDRLELALALRARGSCKPVMVELRGFEPLTPSMRTRCATGLRHSPLAPRHRVTGCRQG